MQRPGRDERDRDRERDRDTDALTDTHFFFFFFFFLLANTVIRSVIKFVYFVCWLVFRKVSSVETLVASGHKAR